MFDIIAFDADDTLWRNEMLYVDTRDRFIRLMSKYQVDGVGQKLDTIEIGNIEYFGYGIKSFILSMVEAAVELTDGQIQGQDVQKIVGFAKDMLNAPVQLLAHVEETVAGLSREHDLMVITKGDLLDQERKLSRSGLAGYFKHIEIVSEKTSNTYTAITKKHDITPQRFLMVGNSVKSDVMPVVAIGGQAVHIPFETTWSHEAIANPDRTKYHELEHMGKLSALVEELSGNDTGSGMKM